MLDLRDSNALPPTLSTLRRQHPTTGVVIVAARLDPVLMLEAMRAGVTEWVTNPVTSADFLAALERVTVTRSAAVQGQLFAFVGAKGGVGTTTLAVNVAAALARLTGERTLFIDLHMSYGDAAVFFGAEPRFSVVDAIENTHRLDEAFFDSLVVSTKSRVHLLASADRTTHGADLGRVGTLLHFAGAHYRSTFLDVPRSEAAALDALESVSKIIIVANQELATVRNAGRMATALRQRYGKDRIRVVLTRYDKQAEISQEDVERVIGLAVKHVVPSDYRAALQALNKGRPLALDGGTRLADAFTAIASDLSGVRSERQADGRRAASSAGLRDKMMQSLNLKTTDVTAKAPAGGRPVNRAPGGYAAVTSGGDTRSAHYQTLKGRVHHELLNRLNLERLTRVSRREAEPEIRELINGMIEAEAQTTPLSLYERENLITDVLDELFGLGPLEALLKDRDISDILVNRHDQVYIERNGVLEETSIMFRDDRHLMQIIERIVSSVGAASTSRARWSTRGCRTARA